MALSQKQIQWHDMADLTALTASALVSPSYSYIISENAFYTKVAGINTLINYTLTQPVVKGSFTAITDSIITSSYIITVSPSLPTVFNTDRIELFHNGIRLSPTVRWVYLSHTTTSVTINILSQNAFPVMTGDELEIVIK